MFGLRPTRLERKRSKQQPKAQYMGRVRIYSRNGMILETGHYPLTITDQSTPTRRIFKFSYPAVKWPAVRDGVFNRWDMDVFARGAWHKIGGPLPMSLTANGADIIMHNPTVIGEW